MGPRGFTLFELLLAITLVAIIGTIIYTGFATVVDSVEIARAAAEELRLRQFLKGSFSANFTGAYNFTNTHISDEGLGSEMADWSLIGQSDNGPEGPTDSVNFVSNAPIMGGLALPGQLKVVNYEVVRSVSALEDQLDFGDEAEAKGKSSQMLEVIETPWPQPMILEAGRERSPDEVDPGEEGLCWTVPIQSLDITYFDGEEWLDEWDVAQRLPWCVHIRINFPRTREERQAEEADQIDAREDADLEMVIPIPMGLGIE